jgi:zinc/manganese transport system substrate-binding protein
MMRRRALLIGLLAQLAMAPGMGAHAATVPVIATFSILADMVRQIGGGQVDVMSLVPPDTDVHAWQPTVADSRALTESALLVENGLGLEGWIGRLGAASGFRGIRIAASAGVTPRTMREGKTTVTDPHAWQDPRNGVRYARAIAEGLTAADPLHADVYRTAAAAYVARIQETDAWIEGRFAPIPPKSRRIITTHDAFGYYGERYGISFLAAEGISPDAEPSAKAIAALVQQIKRERVRTVFLENMTNPRLTTMLAREAGATISGPLYSDALSKPDGPAPDYLTMLRYNTSLFERALRPS